MHTVYLILGSNLGDSGQQLADAVRLIQDRVGDIVDKSALYETAAWGVNNQPNYLNQVLKVHTALVPEQTLNETLQIEKELGRKRNVKWEARMIDIDILFYDAVILDTPRLKIPHPLLHLRRFVLAPLIEIAPDLIHPLYQMGIADLFEKLDDNLLVKRMEK
ncbi:2-amino-4-hydroxy-6-hydroxymethyldihydropteridine diphosphokinase [Olivibacter sp. XZL3]|uniref:2-amino-4-hydroxy-6- hydroxymethyldihydropteridine diphosphokinase n=1 Tax=Olivibacter sp. XZL3 TaxID=1735116 RepID=UPI001066B02E|nr:2-amino-4-hydroxy-6-hydroxymethyldihydropteridine diphosphokinase [Olivibacter sp. XZL3]